MIFNFPIPILLSIGAIAFCNADTTDLYSTVSLERKTQEMEMSWTKQSTCGPINYKSGIYKRWDLDDPLKPTSTGKCSGQCRKEGPTKCKGFVFYYKKKNCLLLNYEADKSKFKEHTSAACGYWIQPSTPTPSPKDNPTTDPTLAPTQPECRAKIKLKFAKKADDIPTFGTHNDYLIVTKKSKKKNIRFLLLFAAKSTLGM